MMSPDPNARPSSDQILAELYSASFSPIILAENSFTSPPSGNSPSPLLSFLFFNFFLESIQFLNLYIFSSKAGFVHDGRVLATPIPTPTVRNSSDRLQRFTTTTTDPLDDFPELDP
jgi:hypothetical protein